MLVLASTSAYRRELLARLGLPFEIAAPQIDETPLPAESCADTALRLAAAKARAVASRYPGALIIGSDQVADLDGMPLGKPGTHLRACAQLRAASGRSVIFHTALALLHSDSGRLHSRVVPTRVLFRSLSDAQIESYLQRERPYDCAGSAKAEGLGIALLGRLEGEDPTALIGLPLIALVDLLAAEGIDVV
jgi:septum formation protein